MAKLRYDYALAYDALVEYDQVDGPEVAYVGVEQTSTDQATVELGSLDGHAELGSGPDGHVNLAASDLPLTLSSGNERHLEVEGRP